VVTIVVVPNTVGPITNTAQVTANQPDLIPSNNTATATTNVNPVTDLSISKSDNLDPVIAGTDLTYSLTVTNSGPSPATGVTITDALPSTVTYLSASSGCSNPSGTVTCTLGNLAVNGSKTVTISVRVKSSTTGQVSNTASVSGNVFDSNTNNNSATETTAVQKRTDLTLSKLDNPDPVIAGNNLSYTLVVTNNGPSDVTGAGAIVISDPLPAQVTFISASTGCSLAAGTVTCSLGNLVSGSGSSVNIVVKVNSSTTGQISNTASVTTTLDHIPGNNSASALTTVNTQANLSLTKVGSPSSVLPEDNITYNLTVTNNGPSDATGVILTDNLPSAVIFVSAPGCSQAGSVVTCNLGTIASSSNKPATIVVKVKDNATGSVQNTASVTSGVTDPAPANNSANISTSIGEFNKVYLPLVTKPAPAILSIHNDNTGGNVTFSVLGTGVSCTVPNNTTQLCGAFPPGAYTVQVTSPCGPPATFTRDYGSGPVTTRVFCK